jgi:PAS domain S-box-containing protein
MKTPTTPTTPTEGTDLSQAELLNRLNEAQATAHIGSWSWDLRTQIIWWSDETYRILGLTPGSYDPSYEGNARFVHPDDAAAYHAKAMHVLEHGGVLDAEIRIITATGEIKHCHSRGKVERDESGRPIRMFGTMHDVTQSKRAEEALRASEARYRLIVENTQEGIWQIDTANVTTFVNARMAEMLGYEREAMVGRSVFDFMDEDLRGAAGELIERRRSGVREQHEFKLRHRDGRGVYALMKTDPLKDERGNYIGALAVVTDITERRRADAALRESEERFRQLAASLPQLVWTCDAQGLCDYLSPRWEEYTGKRAADQLGLVWLEQIHPDDRDRIAHEWQDAQHHRRPTRTEFRILGANGTYRWFDTRGVPLFDAQGNITRWIGSNTDIEDRRRAEEAQLRTQKMEALGTLAGGIAHDFNNMLLAISGNAQLAIEDVPQDHPARASLLEIQKASARASDLVRRILAFSRHEEPKQQVIKLQPVIEEALKLSGVSLPAMIELRSHFAAGVPSVNADATQLHQVIMNLISNAAHAIGQRVGLIDVSLDVVKADFELMQRIPGLRTQRYARLRVRDDGCGMDRETLARIFDPFFTTKPQGEGTGLGLSVVDGIMKRHDGAIRVISEPARGTTFELYFPTVDDARVAVAAASTVETRDRGARVVYVDDDDALVLLCDRFLARRGHAVVCFTDPQAALEYVIAHSSAIDAVVTDLAMPKMSGFELARALLAQLPQLPIILMSGYLTPADQDRAADVGIRAVLLKPANVDDLSRALDATLREQMKLAR